MAIISTDHRSGMSANIKNSRAFSTKNFFKIDPELRRCSFLMNHRDMKITYPILKNSTGWMDGSHGILSHPLAHHNVVPRGVNTNNWKMSTITDTKMRNFSFLNILRGVM